MTDLHIGSRPVGDYHPTYVIAEAGTNHDGDLDRAKALVEVAADAGADAVKFQTFRARHVTVEESGEADYLDDDTSIYEMLESLEMPYDWIPALADHCADYGVDFLSTGTDPDSIDYLEEYVPAFKVSSYELSHRPLLDHLATKAKPLILSTGAHTLEEIRESVEYLHEQGVSDIILLHCVASYPALLSDSNLRTMAALRDEFGVTVGLSDHTLDPSAAPTTSVALGAAIVEKHVTFSRNLPGPDHGSALEPDELAEMVERIRMTENALGRVETGILDVERELHEIARRHIHATTDITAGETLTTQNTAVLRSGTVEGTLDPKHYETILGRTATRDLSKGVGITWDDVDGTPDNSS